MRAPRLGRNATVVTLFGLVLAVSAVGVSADQRLDRFNTAYDWMRQPPPPIIKDWLGPESPFGPYLNTKIVDGLGPRERQLLSQVLGRPEDCALVHSLGKLGFLTQHPYLTEAFRNVGVQTAFEVHIVKRLLPCCPGQTSGDRAINACCEPCGKGP